MISGLQESATECSNLTYLKKKMGVAIALSKYPALTLPTSTMSNTTQTPSTVIPCSLLKSDKTQQKIDEASHSLEYFDGTLCLFGELPWGKQLI